MPARNIIDTAALFKNEAIYATDIVPSGANDAVLLKNFEIETVQKLVPRELLRLWFGADPALPAYSLAKGKFTVEIASAGAAGTAPMWGRMLRTSGFAEAITAATRVDYTLVSSALESASMYSYDSGVQKKSLGLRTNITAMRLLHAQRPEIDFDFLALDGGDSAVATPALTLTPWKAPLIVNTTNTGLVTLGCAYAAGALSGGTTYPSKGLEITGLGSSLEFQELLGGEAVDLNGRALKGRVSFDLTAAQEITFLSTMKAGTVQSMGILHGQTAGAKVINFFPAAQIRAVKKDKGAAGKRLITCEFDLPPSAGNDEWRIVAL